MFHWFLMFFLCFSLNLLILFDFSLICIDFSLILIDFYCFFLVFLWFFLVFYWFFFDFCWFSLIAGSNTMVNGQLNGPNSPSQQLGAVPGTAYMTAVLGYEGDEPEREIYIHKNTHTYIHLHIRLHNLDTLIYTHKYKHTHLSIYICIYTRSHFGSRVK